MSYRFFAIAMTLLASLLVGSPRATLAQCDAPQVVGQTALAGIHGEVYFLAAWDPDGAGPMAERLVALGPNLLGAGTVDAHGVVMYDGANWRALPYVPMDSLFQVFGSAIHEGNLYIATGLTVARLDGAQWTLISPGISSPHALASFGGQLYAAGSQWIGQQVNRGVFRWNGASWEPVGEPFTAGSAGLAMDRLIVFNNQLIVAGAFAGSGSITSDAISVWDGSSWGPLAGGLPVSGQNKVLGMAEWGGRLAALVQNVNGSVGTFVLTDGIWSQLSSGVVGATNVVSDGVDLYVVGRMATSNASVSSFLSRWSGGIWEPLATTTRGSDKANVAIVYNGELTIGGRFIEVNLDRFWNVARFESSSWKSIGPGFDGWPLAFTNTSGGVVAVGEFRHAGLSEARYAARWNGLEWSSMGSGLVSKPIAAWTFAGQPVAGGRDIVSLAGSTKAVARFDGTQWIAMGTRLSGEVRAFAELGGQLYAAGPLNLTDPAETTALARWDGQEWQAVPVGFTSAYAMIAYHDSLIIGRFPPTGGAPVVQWDGQSVLPIGTGFAGPSGTQPYVLSLGVFRDELIAGGHFSTAGGVSARNIARWDGSSWRQMSVGIDGDVECIAPLQGRLFARDSNVGPELGVNVWDGVVWGPFSTTINGFTAAIELPNGELMFNTTSTLPDGSPSYMVTRCTVGPLCRADFNCSGQVSVQDVFDFLGAYFGDNLRADYNGSGGTNTQDIFDFLTGYFNGC